METNDITSASLHCNQQNNFLPPEKGSGFLGRVGQSIEDKVVLIIIFTDLACLEQSYK